jgi:4-hydroxybenzoate polyprenyltransferase
MHGYRGYLELTRPANVATALADVLAGYAVAGLANHTALAWLLLSTACLYAGGVVLNDVFDRDIDRAERPERPIPSGRVPVGAASILGGGLLALGVLAGSLATAAAGLVAAATAVSVLLYDAWGKRQGLLGPVNMGMCRGLNLLLGIAAAPAVLADAWPLGLLPLVYIAAVTAVSRGEVHGGRRGIAAFALISLSAVVASLLALALRHDGGSWAGVGFTVLLAWRVLPAFWGAYQTPEPGTIRRAIRTGVLSLVLLDAVIGATYGGALYSLAIVATGLMAWSLARLFAVT